MNEENEDLDLDDDIDEFDDDGNLIEKPETKPTVLDPASIAREVSAAVAEQFARNQPQQQQQQMTPEELQKHLAVWNPDDGFVNELNALADPEATPAQKRKILNGLRDGIMQQAFRATQLMIEQETAKIRQEFKPASEFASNKKAETALKEFTRKYPALKDQADLVDSITSSLAQKGFKPKSKDEAFEKVATIAEGILKKVNPQFTLKANGGVNGKPSMAGSNMGGMVGNSPQPRQPEKRGGLASFYRNSR